MSKLSLDIPYISGSQLGLYMWPLLSSSPYSLSFVEEAAKLNAEFHHVKNENSRLENEIKAIREQVADMKTEHMITCIGRFY